MKKYLTIKNGDKFYRMLQFEQSKSDGSIIVRNIYFLHSKITHHTNYGRKNPPYETHLRGCTGEIIQDSIRQGTKFITDYDSAFAKYHFTKLPDSQIITTVLKDDIVLDVTNKNFNAYHIWLFATHKNDLLNKKFDNVMIAIIPLRYDYIIVNCF